MLEMHFPKPECHFLFETIAPVFLHAERLNQMKFRITHHVRLAISARFSMRARICQPLFHSYDAKKVSFFAEGSVS
jgi:hypothetical protein